MPNRALLQQLQQAQQTQQPGSQRFPFITDGIHGDVPINLYPASDSERGVLLNPTPGLKSLCQLPGCSEVRGLYPLDGFLYAVARRGSESVLWRIDTSGGYSELGTISTSSSGPVWMVNNPTQLLIVDGVSGYIYTPSTGLFVQITDPDFPGAAACAYQDGYGLFVRPNSNEWFFSSMWDFSQFDALDFYQKQSKPDNLVSILSFKREPWLFGEKSTEVWFNYGGDNSSPVNPTFAIGSGGQIEHGCGAAASPSDLCGEAVVWLSSVGQVRLAVGYASQVISNQMFDRAVKAMPRFDDARAFSYRDEGHIFYQITFPSGDQTWVWDLTTKVWHKRSSYKTGGYGRHRANCYAWLDGKHYVGDYENGKVYEMSTSYYDDDGREIQRVLHSKEVDGGLERLYFQRMQVIVEAGVGTETLDPKIMLQFSADGGRSWSNELWRSAGKVGEYTRRAVWNQLGSGYRRMYRLTMTDPVLWRILGVSWGME